MTYSTALSNDQLRIAPVEVTDADKLILAELRVISTLLQIGLCVSDTVEDIRNDVLDDMAND